jgi:hypothetical protein
MQRTVEEGLTARDYEDALAVQEASNLSGVVISFGEVMRRVVDDVRQRNRAGEQVTPAEHPIAVMYATQIAHLCRVGLSSDAMDRYGVAYKACETRAVTK